MDEGGAKSMVSGSHRISRSIGPLSGFQLSDKEMENSIRFINRMRTTEIQVAFFVVCGIVSRHVAFCNSLPSHPFYNSFVILCELSTGLTATLSQSFHFVSLYPSLHFIISQSLRLLPFWFTLQSNIAQKSLELID